MTWFRFDLTYKKSWNNFCFEIFCCLCIVDSRHLCLVQVVVVVVVVVVELFIIKFLKPEAFIMKVVKVRVHML